MMIWVKAMHIAALSVWVGGLVSLPALLRRDSEFPDRETLVRQHHFSRFAYDALVSPAAVLAIATGIALVFSGVEIGDWLVLKMMAVVGMAIVHMQIGRVFDQLEAPDARPTNWRRVTLTAASVIMASAAIWFVLARPTVDRSLFPGWMIRGQSDASPFFAPNSGASSSSSLCGSLMPT